MTPMARSSRIVIPELPHHVTQRGNHQQDEFFNDSDREMYLTLLVEYAQKHALQIEGYCLMTNHVNLVVVPERGTRWRRRKTGPHPKTDAAGQRSLVVT